MAVSHGAGGKVLESYNRVRIRSGSPTHFYEIEPLVLSEAGRELSQALCDSLSGKVASFALEQRLSHVPKGFSEAFSKSIAAVPDMGFGSLKIPSFEEIARLRTHLAAIICEYFPTLTDPEAVAAYAVDFSVGFGALSPLVSDMALEEIMVNGINRPVFVVHRRFGMCQTNVSFSDSVFLDALLTRIARTVNKQFDESFPLLDARLSDGNRVNATFSSVSPAGSTLTIRKFEHAHFSVTDLINRETLSSELAAFLWLCVEGVGVQPMNVIVTGGTGSGKTTLLNCLASFIPLSKRIVSIEDTLELELGQRPNWVALESIPKSRTLPAVSMEELLQNALRMRPDRLVVGEVRASEAQTLFVAMDTGHDGTLGTVHANSAKEMLLRLRSPPMNVPESMLGLVDLVLVAVRVLVPGKGLVRRVSQVAEVSSMGEKPLISNLFEWDKKTDLLVRTQTPSHLLQVLSERTLRSQSDLRSELKVRQKVLEWMHLQKIVSHAEVSALFSRYYENPSQVLHEILSTSA